MIPLVDLTRIPKPLKELINKNISDVIDSSDFTLGKKLNEFEEKFASYVGTKYCVGVASGTDAILLSLKALGLGPGDEVIVPSFTFIATVTPLLMLGIKPVFVDIKSDLPLIDTTQIEKAVTKKTKAIIPVHLYGFPADMEKILDIAKKHNLYVIEDACQAHGSQLRGKKMGSFGIANAFSYYPSKNLGAYGDAGAVTTSNRKIYEKLLSLRHHGQKEKYVHLLLGYTSRLDTLQAAVLDAKLDYLDEFNNQRRKIAKLYDSLLERLPLKTFKAEKESIGNYHIYAIRTKGRDALFKFLHENRVSCGIHYPIPLHLQPALKNLGYSKGEFPNSEKLAEECLSLPIFPGMTEEEVEKIADLIEKFHNS